MSAPVLDLWFEFGSTYSHIAAHRIEGVAQSAGVAVRWRPFLLGPIFRDQGWNDSPFNLFPAKGRYMWRDMERQCEKFGVPFRRPSVFPRNGLLAARVACLAADASWLADFVRCVYAANFSEDREIAEPATLESILESLGQPGAETLARAGAPENKRRLRDETETARSLGVFGAPTFETGGELFWGNDRLEDAVAHCARAARS